MRLLDQDSDKGLLGQLNENDVLNQGGCLACAGLMSFSSETWPRETLVPRDPTLVIKWGKKEEPSFKGINDKCHSPTSSGVLYIRRYFWNKIPVKNTIMLSFFTEAHKVDSASMGIICQLGFRAFDEEGWCRSTMQ